MMGRGYWLSEEPARGTPVQPKCPSLSLDDVYEAHLRWVHFPHEHVIFIFTPNAPNTNTWSPLLPQSRKDKERLKQKHKKRPESPPSILTPPVVPTADKVLLPIPRRDGHDSGREARCEGSG